MINFVGMKRTAQSLICTVLSECRKRHSESCAFFDKCVKIDLVIKMIVKGKRNREQVEIFSIEEFVPAEHLLRKIDSAVDFTHIYDIVEDLYCADNGRPSIDPVVIFKMVLIQHLYGIPSLRRTVEEIKMNVAYRWFFRVFNERRNTALFHDQLQFQAQIYRKNNRGNILLDIG